MWSKGSALKYVLLYLILYQYEYFKFTEFIKTTYKKNIYVGLYNIK